MVIFVFYNDDDLDGVGGSIFRESQIEVKIICRSYGIFYYIGKEKKKEGCQF